MVAFPKEAAMTQLTIRSAYLVGLVVLVVVAMALVATGAMPQERA